MEENIFDVFRRNSNESLAKPMAAYMKNSFPFLGIKSQNRRDLQKPFLNKLLKEKEVNWPFVIECFEQPEREFQYVVLDYLGKVKKRIPEHDIVIIEQLIQTKSWWDSVDSFDQVVGALVLNFPELKSSHIRKWMNSDNIWLKRVSIDFQLLLKQKTDTNILAEAILANLGTKEFFINKAIGWSLRDYSKTNPAWVKGFMEEHKQNMHSLSVREGSKYL